VEAIVGVMKKRLIQMMGLSVMFVLRAVDRVFYGSVSPLSAAALTNDPYEGYRIGRERGAILRSVSNRGWLVLGFEEAQALFKDTRFSSDVRTNKFLTGVIKAASQGRKVSLIDDPTMLNQDAPVHTRLRKLVSQGFLHKYIQSLEPRIESIVDRCLDDYDPDTGQYDIVAQLAGPLPAIVIAQMLGLPESDLARFQELSHRLLGLTAIGDDERMEAGSQANEELVDYFKDIIEGKRKQPGQDMISRLIAAEEEGDRLTPEEMYSTCVLLLVAGHETTTRLIGNGMYTLLQHEDQLELLKNDQDLTPNAVEEMLRYEPPVQLMPRYAVEDIEFFGKKIKKNQMIVSIIASANRDPRANENPDVFDITRENVTHVSFGYGIHLCLGLSLARLEARVAINKLLERFPDMVLAEQDIKWSGTALVRGIDNLLIDVEPGESLRRSAA
jgi:cytochrome P450